MLTNKTESRSKLAMKIITGLAVGVFALSGLALTGCSSDSTENIKEQFLETDLFTQEDSTTYTVSEPYELIDFRCDQKGKDADITATVKNNICEMTVKAEALLMNEGDSEPRYTFSYTDYPEITNVYQVVNRVPEYAEKYEPDFDNQEIVFENGVFKGKVSFNNPPIIFNTLTMNAELSNDYRPMCTVPKDQMPYSYEQGCDRFEGTWVTDEKGAGVKTVEIKSNGETMDLTMKIDKNIKSQYESDYAKEANGYIPPQTVTFKDIEIIGNFVENRTMESYFPNVTSVDMYEMVHGKKSKVTTEFEMTLATTTTDSFSLKCVAHPVDDYYIEVDLTDYSTYHKQ